MIVIVIVTVPVLRDMDSSEGDTHVLLVIVTVNGLPEDIGVSTPLGVVIAEATRAHLADVTPPVVTPVRGIALILVGGIVLILVNVTVHTLLAIHAPLPDMGLLTMDLPTEVGLKGVDRARARVRRLSWRETVGHTGYQPS